MKRVLHLIAAADRARANQAAKTSYDKRGGDRTFTAKLSPTGADPATHYICAGLLATDDYALVKAQQASYPGAQILDWNLDTEKEKSGALLAQLGLKFIQPPPFRADPKGEAAK